MMMKIENIAGRLMRCPAAPGEEAAVAAEARRICVEQNLDHRFDRFGNLIVSLRKAPKTRPLILAAHLDHPGFVIRKRLSPRTLTAEFLGGVGDDYFKEGFPLRLLPGGSGARLGRRLEAAKRVFEVIEDAPRDEAPAFAVWELPDFELKDGRITGRACDDLVGASAVLHVLSELARSRARVNVIGVLSRAEEIGFLGALALAQSGQLPKRSLLISLETSRELPPVQMGGGVIIRVGDRASTFDPAGTRFLCEVAGDLAKEDAGFRFQRALMSGGTCEATAYQEYGYRTAAVCIALGNYHNCAPDHTIGPEYVSVADAQGMSLLLQRCAAEMGGFERITGRLPKRLNGYARTAIRDLTRKKLRI